MAARTALKSGRWYVKQDREVPDSGAKPAHPQSPQAGDAMSEDEVLSDTLRFADVVFRKFAERTAASDGATFEEAYAATWQLYELGHLKLVGKGEGLSVRVCITRAERRAVAKQNRPLATYWRRTVFAARSGTEREQEARSTEEPAMVNAPAFDDFAKT